ncbi:hypothetical protein, partial [Herbaspirillum sp. B65]|uniref:hypothetical protein n=1 Tax=Herbaspirillum sp. B65 TaxID=137708 RepID=UPI001C25A2F9
ITDKAASLGKKENCFCIAVSKSYGRGPDFYSRRLASDGILITAGHRFSLFSVKRVTDSHPVFTLAKQKERACYSLEILCQLCHFLYRKCEE